MQGYQCRVLFFFFFFFSFFFFFKVYGTFQHMPFLTNNKNDNKVIGIIFNSTTYLFKRSVQKKEDMPIVLYYYSKNKCFFVLFTEGALEKILSYYSNIRRHEFNFFTDPTLFSAMIYICKCIF